MSQPHAASAQAGVRPNVVVVVLDASPADTLWVITATLLAGAVDGRGPGAAGPGGRRDPAGDQHHA